MTQFDQIIQTKDLQIMKSILPFMEPKLQKQLAIWISFIQFQKAIQRFSREPGCLCACNLPEGCDRTSALLGTLREFCSEDEQQMIDQFITMQTLFENYETFMN